MLDNLQGFHLEPTNICTLKCPRCSRTKFLETFPNQWKNTELNLEDLIKFIDIPLENKFFRLCGDYGDPIYYSKLFDLIKWIKNKKAQISLHTNGSYKTKEWWQELCSYLDAKDTVVFAIDGTPENFTQYRINADWNSIQVGIEQCVKHVRTVWQYIPFSYNTETIEQARQISIDLGCDEFVIIPSSRWDSDNDSFRPNKSYTANHDKEIQFRKNQRAQNIKPRCKETNFDHFITASGFYTPCCHVSNHNFYFKSEFYKENEKYDISKTTLTQVLKNVSYFYSTLETVKPIYCIYNCPSYD